MKNSFLILIFCIAGSGLFAGKIDSLQQQLLEANAVEEAFLWSELGYAYEQSGELDSALSAYGRCIQCGETDMIWKGRCLRYTGMLYQSMYDYTNAVSYFQQAIDVLKQADSMAFDLAKTWHSLAEAHYLEGGFESATEAYLRSADLFEQLEMPHLAGLNYGNIGAIYMELGQATEAIRFHRRNLRLSAPEGDAKRTATACYNIAAAFEELDSLEEAVHWYDTTLQLIKGEALPRLQTYCLVGKASYFFKLNNLIKANTLMDEAITLAPDSFTLTNVLARKGYYEGLSGRKNAAYEFLDEALNISLRLGQQGNQLETLDFYREVAAHHQDYPKAYQLLQAYRELEDSLGMQELKSRIHELEVQYASVKREEENQRLRAENAERELKLNQAERGLRSRTFMLIGALFLLALGMTGFIFFRKNARQKRLLAEQEASLSRQRLSRLAQAQQLLAAEAVLEGQEKERVRLARELHDGIGGMLASAKRLLESEMVSSQQEGAKALDDVSQELRRVAHDLMPGALQKFGLRVALTDMIEQTPGPPEASLQWYGDESRLSDLLKTNIFRSVQELFYNALKHAEASEVLIQIMVEESHVHITVEDDGKGHEGKPEATGLGLANVEARAAYMGGNYELESEAGKGTSVYIHLPISLHDTTTDH